MTKWSLVFITLAYVTGMTSATSESCTSEKDASYSPPVSGGTSGVYMVGVAAFLLLLGVTVGSDVTCGTLRTTMKDNRRAFVAGLACQFGFMPLCCFCLSLVMPESDAFCNKSSFALAILLPGIIPGGTTSNLMTFLIGGNVDLSILMSFISNGCAAFMMPLLIFIYYEARFLDDSMAIQVPYAALLTPIIFLLIAVGMGVAMKTYCSERVTKNVQRVCATVTTLVFVLIAFAGFYQVMPLFSNPKHITVPFVVLGLLLQPLGYFAGLLIAYAVFRCDLGDSLTISIETGVQNLNLGVALIVAAFDPEEDRRIVNDLALNGFMGPLVMYPFHCAWMLIFYRYISKRFSGRSTKAEGPASEREAVDSQVSAGWKSQDSVGASSEQTRSTAASEGGATPCWKSQESDSNERTPSKDSLSTIAEDKAEAGELSAEMATGSPEQKSDVAASLPFQERMYRKAISASKGPPFETVVPQRGRRPSVTDTTTLDAYTAKHAAGFERLLALDNPAGWTFKKEEEGVTIYTQAMPGNPLVYFKGVSDFESSGSMLDIAATLIQTEERPMWDELCMKGSTLEFVPPFYKYSFTQFRARAGIISARDMCTLGRMRFEGDGSMLIFVQSAEHPDYPEQAGFVRMQLVEGGYILRPKPGNPKVTTVSWMGCADPKGWLPTWLVNLLVAKQALTLAKVKEHMAQKKKKDSQDGMKPSDEDEAGSEHSEPVSVCAV
jgi:predicted Na+-dependent transporter